MMINTLVASSVITCSAEKVYDFFKSKMDDLVKIFPLAFKGVKVVEGVDGTVGCVKEWSYLLGGVPLTAKVKVTALDDAAKTIEFVVLEGNLLILYKSFKATLVASEGSVKWTFAFEKATLLSPPPELYVPLVVTISHLVDAYLLVAA